MELSQNQTSHLMKRFPEFELSYETISHKKVSPLYNICLAIPTGKKCFAWFTFHQDQDICYFMDLNREKKVSKVGVMPTLFDRSLSLGTIVYGTFIKEENSSGKEENSSGKEENSSGKEEKSSGKEESGCQWFVIEDILFYKGVNMKKSNFGERLAFLAEFMTNIKQEFRNTKDTVFVLPVIWEAQLNETMEEYPTTMPTDIYYPVHHLQYRSHQEVMPYLNVNINKKITSVITKKNMSISFETPQVVMDFTKPQYKYPTVFQVMADIQFDIYHLFAYGKDSQPVYYNLAYIPNYKSSVFMNGLFRNIRENKNLDYIEESDDEEDFQNMNIDKYVHIEKVLLMECVFNRKFKRWTPTRVVNPKEKIIHVGKLIK
jgi:hypothetical protein